ncbi:MAG: hypothetical protein CM15mP124_7130 [Alphaproteobacteria bacterium]|nr:MAG: hypothetical protein CM15mP124_7130 [Alphaproteobacteria bacterium]
MYTQNLINIMTDSNFYKKLNKLRAKIKEKRKQELYEMINDEKIN